MNKAVQPLAFWIKTWTLLKHNLQNIDTSLTWTITAINSLKLYVNDDDNKKSYIALTSSEISFLCNFSPIIYKVKGHLMRFIRQFIDGQTSASSDLHGKILVVLLVLVNLVVKSI